MKNILKRAFGLESYPSWPGVVWDDDLDSVPKQVLALKRKIVRKEVGPLHLVQFYDKLSSWSAFALSPRSFVFGLSFSRQWLEPSKLHLLGENDGASHSLIVHDHVRCHV